MTTAVLVAAGAAGIVGLSEQVVAFPAGQRLRLSGKAWLLLAFRFALDAGFAVLVAFLASATMNAALDAWWHGLTVALFSVLGVRSPGFEAGDQAIGLQQPFNRLRSWVSGKVKVLGEVVSSADMQRAREELTRLAAPVYWVAERLDNHLSAMTDLEDAAKQAQHDRVVEQRDDAGTEDILRHGVLLNIAHELGGDELVQDIVARAREKPWQEDRPTTAT